MGARSKLNSAYFAGSFFLACVVGLIADSWVAFIMALVIFVALNCYSGEIRPKGRAS